MTVEDFKEIAAKYGIECQSGDRSTYYYMMPNSNWYMVNFYLNNHLIIRKYFRYDVRIGKIIPSDYFDKEPSYIQPKDFEEYVKEMLKNYKEACINHKKEEFEKDFVK